MVRRIARLKLVIGSLLVMLLAAVPLALAQDGGALPDMIVAEREGFFPEGIEYDEQGGRYLLSSLAEGTIFTVTDDGMITPFITEEELMSSVGIHIDRERSRLLVANTDRAVTEGGASNIMLMAYDLVSGNRLFAADLMAVAPEGRHFANDVTVDAEGNAYVTDSFSPVIYRVDVDGNASVFAQDERFASAQFGLNGIDYHPNGYLIAAKASDGALFKIPVDDPQNITQVELDIPVTGADGIIFHPDGSLIVVGSPQTVFSVSSSDDWATASVVEQVTLAQPATTAAIRDGEVYALFAHLNQMGSETPPAAFEIVRVPLAQNDGAGETADSEPAVG
ncbi:MAG: SMP-30/gluconolactonase/LRE family protein [Chloroflexi bacterium]|jgi:sugar lactone lactonase YvrE|nr:SMP-30/gluconolactonase/LRE family protein [Chloroflexota bacterium]